MNGKAPPIELDDDELGETAGGQRSRVTSLTVTFDTQTTLNKDDPDKPVIIGSVPNTGH